MPRLVELCTALVEERGLDSEGIYRVPGNSAAIKSLSAAVNRGINDVDLTVSRGGVAATALVRGRRALGRSCGTVGYVVLFRGTVGGPLPRDRGVCGPLPWDRGLCGSLPRDRGLCGPLPRDRRVAVGPPGALVLCRGTGRPRRMVSRRQSRPSLICRRLTDRGPRLVDGRHCADAMFGGRHM